MIEVQIRPLAECLRFYISGSVRALVLFWKPWALAMIRSAKDLSPDQKSVLEGLLDTNILISAVLQPWGCPLKVLLSPGRVLFDFLRGIRLSRAIREKGLW
jgi:hypothetical protein